MLPISNGELIPTTEEIVCTAEHPFYILNASIDTPIVEFEGQESRSSNGSWVAAKDLVENMEVMLYNGNIAVISKVSTEVLDTPETTYNFEVEGSHTYFVSESAVLVHNTCADDVFNNFDIDNAYVKPKHLATTKGNGAKFAANSKMEAETMLRQAMLKKKIVSSSYDGLTNLGFDKYKYILDAGQVVGTKG